MAMEPPGKRRELVRNKTVLQEFDDSEDPDLLVLYHHMKDSAFDCFNAGEYNEQMLRYYSGGIRVALVAPRRIRKNDYFLVCLQNQKTECNVLCELAFQCMRQFNGVSVLVKKRCFVCNKPDARMCSACKCACFCSRECQKSGWAAHKKLCKLIKSSPVVVDEEVVQVEL